MARGPRHKRKGGKLVRVEPLLATAESIIKGHHLNPDLIKKIKPTKKEEN